MVLEMEQCPDVERQLSKGVLLKGVLLKGVLNNFANFTGKHLCQSLFFNKVAGGACIFIKKETLT